MFDMFLNDRIPQPILYILPTDLYINVYEITSLYCKNNPNEHQSQPRITLQLLVRSF